MARRRNLAQRLEKLEEHMDRASIERPSHIILTDENGKCFKRYETGGTADSVRVSVPAKIAHIFTPDRGEVDYRGAYGGRGSGKSYNFAKMAAILGYVEPLRILCTRELQVSIKESFHAEVKGAIESEKWLADGYQISENIIRSHNGTEFIFRGLRTNMTAIKSMAQIDICIVEEAEDVPEYSWVDLDPTIRADKSEIWVIWNPKKDGSPTDNRFRKHPPARSIIAEMNYLDNPWFTARLENTRKNDLARMDHADYRYIWDGQYLKHSKSQIFANKYRVADFTPDNDYDGPYFGIDWGFAQDPSTAIKMWISNRRLMIEYEAFKTGLELDDTGAFFIDQVPGIGQHTSRADCARPESISYLRRHPVDGVEVKTQDGSKLIKGLPMIEACKKWPGSVEDGVEFLKSFDEIVIHTRCVNTANEFANYSYKVDRLTGDVLPIIVDDFNHGIDAIRYAIGPLIQASGGGGTFSW